MFLYDLVHDRQAEAGAFMFSTLVLGGEERVEDVFKICFLDAVARSFCLDLHARFPAGFDEFPSSNTQYPALFTHRIQCVEKEVEKDLLNLLTVQHDTR